MLRFLFVLTSVFIVGFLIVHDTWMITITAFGFEVTTSLLVVVVAVVALFYVLHLLKKPFYWFRGCRDWYARRKQTQKEAYLLLALKTALDHDSTAVSQLLKQKNTFFDKKSDENYLIEALFKPSAHAFEQLLHREKTELAGIKGLLSYAQQNGDLAEVERLLQKAVQKHPNEMWIEEALWTVQTLQSDWAEALKTLDTLKKNNLVDKENYTLRRALILLKLGRFDEAYKLLPDHPAVAVAYATSVPKKARDILIKLWAKEPCRDAYLLFQKMIADETPAKQLKSVEKLVHGNPNHRLSLLALAQTAANNEMWGVAKDQLTAYLAVYPLTASVAHLMADIERKGWHHAEGAREWEEKAATAPQEAGWGCAVCGHQMPEWDILCPHCNAFGQIKYKG